MEILKSHITIESDVNGEKILKDLERFGRVCYKSEHLITEESAKDFIGRIIKSGHESVIEHISVTIRIVCDRGVTHEIVRHRIGSYSQESTRYCNYCKKGVQFIEPIFFVDDEERMDIWLKAMHASEKAYNQLIGAGATPQEARSVLPNSLKTEIVVTYNLREWRHFLKLRCSRAAHPQMREVAIAILEELRNKVPIIFDDIPQ